jgi:hypothetical protein
MGSNPSHFFSGVNNRQPGNPLYLMGQLDPTRFHTYFEDFDRFAAADWTITTTEAGAGSATEALGNVDGGVLIVTNDAADDDNDFFQKVGESFKFEAGKDLWFKARFKVSDATQSDFVMGLQITDTTPLAVTDGVYFRKDDGDANLDFVVIKDSTATTATAATTVANDTYFTVAFHYNGKDAIAYYFNDVKLGQSVVTNLPDDEELTISFGIQNGEAVAKVMTLDYIFCAKER